MAPFDLGCDCWSRHSVHIFFFFFFFFVFFETGFVCVSLAVLEHTL